MGAFALLRLVIAPALVAVPSGAWAHHLADDASLRSAAGGLTVALLLAASLGLYFLGLSRLWMRAGPGRGNSRAQAVRFALGWLGLRSGNMAQRFSLIRLSTRNATASWSSMILASH